MVPTPTPLSSLACRLATSQSAAPTSPPGRSRFLRRLPTEFPDLFWLRDETLEDSASLPEPHLLAQEIADDLRAALAQIEDVLGDLEGRVETAA